MVPVTKIVDNGQKVVRNEKREKVKAKPIYGTLRGVYDLLSPEDFSKMSDEELKQWYKERKLK